MDRDQTQVVSTQDDLHQLMERTPQIEVSGFQLSDDEKHLFVTYHPLSEPPGKKQNIVLAALTTAYARISLNEKLQMYAEQAVYYDTDSIILLIPPWMEPPEDSTQLGELKNEVVDKHGEGSKMTCWGCLAPKCYCFK